MWSSATQRKPPSPSRVGLVAGGGGGRGQLGPFARGHVARTISRGCWEHRGIFLGSGRSEGQGQCHWLWSRSQQGSPSGGSKRGSDPWCFSASGGVHIPWRVAPSFSPPPPRLCFVVTPHDSDCPWPRATLPPPTELCFPLHGLLGHISLCLPLVRTCDPTGPIPIIQGNRPSQDSQNHLPSPRQGNVCTASGFKGIFWGWYQLPLPSSPTSLPWPLHSALTNCSWVPLSHLSLAFANGTISTWPGTFQQGLLSRGLPCFGLTMAGTEDHNILPSVTFPGHCAPPQGLEDPVALLRPWPSDRASLSERCGMDGEWKRPYLSGR